MRIERPHLRDRIESTPQRAYMYQWGMIICGNIWQKKNHVHSITSPWIVIIDFKVTTLSETYRFWSSATKALLDKSTGRHRDVCQVRLADTQKTDALRALPDMESEKGGREDGFCVICLCSVVSWVAHTTHIGRNKSSFMYLHHLGTGEVEPKDTTKLLQSYTPKRTSVMRSISRLRNPHLWLTFRKIRQYVSRGTRSRLPRHGKLLHADWNSDWTRTVPTAKLWRSMATHGWLIQPIFHLWLIYKYVDICPQEDFICVPLVHSGVATNKSY